MNQEEDTTEERTYGAILDGKKALRGTCRARPLKLAALSPPGRRERAGKKAAGEAAAGETVPSPVSRGAATALTPRAAPGCPPASVTQAPTPHPPHPPAKGTLPGGKDGPLPTRYPGAAAGKEGYR